MLADLLEAIAIEGHYQQMRQMCWAQGTNLTRQVFATGAVVCNIPALAFAKLCRHCIPIVPLPPSIKPGVLLPPANGRAVHRS